MTVFRKLAHFVQERPDRDLHVAEPPLAASSAGIALGLAVVIAAMSTDAAIVRAQQPAPAPAPAAAKAAPVRSYTYDAGGRRDPFVSLDRSSDPKGSARGRLVGLSGLTINEATVKGVVKSEGRLVAMLQAPDNKTYIVRPNDRLLDGAVRAVTPEAVVFVQQVDDPLSLVKQREIRKPLRPIEEGK